MKPKFRFPTGAIVWLKQDPDKGDWTVITQHHSYFAQACCYDLTHKDGSRIEKVFEEFITLAKAPAIF